MLRLLASICLHLIGNAFGLFVAAWLLPGLGVNLQGFLAAVLIFTVVEVVVGPLIEKTANKSLPALSGGIALVTTFAGLAITNYIVGGLTITGIDTWIIAPLIIWLCTLLAAIILPLLLFKKVLKKARSEDQA